MTQDFAERARALVGSRFRPQGRDAKIGLDCVGLIVTCFDLSVERVPRDYRLRSASLPRLKVELGDCFRRVPPSARRAGDVLLFSIGGEQAHLAVQTELGFVHADARLRRIVETPGEAPWSLLAVYRRRIRRNRDG